MTYARPRLEELFSLNIRSMLGVSKLEIPACKLGEPFLFLKTNPVQTAPALGALKFLFI